MWGMSSSIFKSGGSILGSSQLSENGQSGLLNNDRMNVFKTNLSEFNSLKNSSKSTLEQLVGNFANLTAQQKKEAVMQAYNKEKIIHNLSKMKGKDEFVYDTVTRAIDAVGEQKLKEQLQNVFKGYKSSVEEHYGEKAKDLTVSSMINQFSSDIRKQKMDEALAMRRAKLNASTFLYTN